MDPSQVGETGNMFFDWLNRYGALQCWAVWGMICTVFGPLLFAWAVWKLAGPIARLADYVEDQNKKGGK